MHLKYNIFLIFKSIKKIISSFNRKNIFFHNQKIAMLLSTN